MFDAGPTGREKRVFERLLVRCSVRFKAEGEEALVEGSAKDFSDGGLGLFTRTRLEQNMYLEMQIRLSPQIKALHISGKIVWVEQRQPGLWRAGVCFDEMAFIKVVKVLVSRNLN